MKSARLKSVWRLMGLASQTIYSNSKQKTTYFTFKVISNPLEFKALFHFSLPRTAGGFFLDIPTASSLWSSWLQNRSRRWSPWPEKKKKGSHTKQDKVNREIVSVRRVTSRPGTTGWSGRCEQVHCCREAAARLKKNAIVAEI